MSKRTAVSLIVGVVVAIVFAGQAEAQAVVKKSVTSVNILAPLSVSGSLHAGTLDANHLPMVPHIMISDFLYGCTPQVCGIQSTQYRGKIYSFAHTGYGVKSSTSNGCGVQHTGQPKLIIPDSLSGSLSSLSPPGLIMRL